MNILYEVGIPGKSVVTIVIGCVSSSEKCCCDDTLSVKITESKINVFRFILRQFHTTNVKI